MVNPIQTKVRAFTISDTQLYYLFLNLLFELFYQKVNTVSRIQSIVTLLHLSKGLDEKKGHYGATLVLGAVAVLWLGVLYGSLATLIMLLFQSAPDKDQIVRIWRHRGWTHTIVFALLIGFVVASSSTFPAYLLQEAAIEYGVLSSIFVPPVWLWLFVGASATTSVLGHILADMLTVGGGYKVRPFWPISSKTVSFGVCKSRNDKWNGILFGSGCMAIFAAFLHEVYYSVLPAAITWI